MHAHVGTRGGDHVCSSMHVHQQENDKNQACQLQFVHATAASTRDMLGHLRIIEMVQMSRCQ